MDTGNGAAFVYRSDKGGKMIPMPIVGHWMKKNSSGQSCGIFAGSSAASVWDAGVQDIRRW